MEGEAYTWGGNEEREEKVVQSGMYFMVKKDARVEENVLSNESYKSEWKQKRLECWGR